MSAVGSPSALVASSQSSKSSIPLWIAFIATALSSIVLFFVPAFIIRPFRYQAPRSLWLALTLRQYAPRGTLIAGIATLVIAAALWRRASILQRAGMSLAMLLVASSTVMARMNYFEWMFHPLPSPNFQTAAKSKLDAKEMVMAVRFGGDARAYPISQMAYHHILNDEVG